MANVKLTAMVLQRLFAAVGPDRTLRKCPEALQALLGPNREYRGTSDPRPGLPNPGPEGVPVNISKTDTIDRFIDGQNLYHLAKEAWADDR